MEKETTQTTLEPTFGKSFLEDHAGKVISKPEIALVELVANCWDAGAREVKINWPEKKGGLFEIIDDGTGMTREEFEEIWPELNYNRVEHQGKEVKFPEPNEKWNRSAYGRNGKGRHSLFCFSDRYEVKTWKDERYSKFRVKKSYGEVPFEISLLDVGEKSGHGTKISCKIQENYIEVDDIKELIGIKFSTDPNFEIYINDDKVDLYELEGVDERVFELPEEGEEVKILILESSETDRLSKRHGVAWWVNNRLVGEHSWKGVEGAYLDGRTTEAKKYTVIVKADFMQNEVKQDWTGFKDNERANRITEKINDFILETIQELLQDVRKETKKDVLKKHKTKLRQVSDYSKQQIGGFIDRIQRECPTMSRRDLSNTIDILAKMELSRTGYGLLQKLVNLSPDELDDLHDVLDEWSVEDAKKVLEELNWRLRLINDIENLVDDPEAKELQELQPLFKKGLWIFGPEYEGIKYTSNKSLSTVLERFFEEEGNFENPLKRPDFVALPDSSFGVYSSDKHNEDGKICGVKKVLIVELKRGDSIIRTKHRRQAEDYASELEQCGKLDPDTKIISFVLGSKVDSSPIKIENKNIEIKPRAYNTVLRQAQARTFELKDKIKEYKGVTELEDDEVKDVISQRPLKDFT